VSARHGHCRIRPTTRFGRSSTLRTPPEQVWDRLTENVVASPFTVLGLNPSERVLTMGAPLDTPERYVDCGRSLRAHVRDDEREEFENPVSGNYRYKAVCPPPERAAPHWTDWIAGRHKDRGAVEPAKTCCFARESVLEVVAGIRVSSDGGGTLVSVEVEYTLTSTVMETHADGRPDYHGAWGLPYTTVVTLTATEPSRSDWGIPRRGGVVLCRSTGRLEEEILSLAE